MELYIVFLLTTVYPIREVKDSYDMVEEGSLVNCLLEYFYTIYTQGI